jgi:hypothetical protein
MDQDAHPKTAIEASNNLVDQSDSPSDNTPSPPQEEKASGYGNAEHDFDTGLQAWLQVLGAFFLFFNSWYAWRLIH